MESTAVMCWPRPFMTTNRSRRSWGTTLLEVTVACTLFLGMTSVLLTLLVQNQKTSAKTANHSDTTAELMLLFEKIRREIRSGRVVGVDPQGALLYWRWKADTNGVPLLTAQGTPDWMPGAPADPSVAILGVSDGFLRRNFEGTSQHLAPVGKDGHLTFSWNQGSNTLLLTGGVGQKDPQHAHLNNYRPFIYNIYLSNRE